VSRYLDHAMTDGFNYSLHQVEELVTREFGWGGEISTSGEFVCFCPVHGDKNASLHVGLKNGRILIRCWSHGCEKQIYQDLTSRGAWPQQMESKEAAEKANKSYEKKYPERSQLQYVWNSVPVTHAEAVRQSKRIRDTITLKDGEGRPVIFHKRMVHVYTDGEFAHSIVVRYDSAGHKKRIMQYSYGWFDSHDEPNRPTDPNRPKWQIKGWSSERKHMLYALTYLTIDTDATIVVVEGEKAADFGNAEIRARYPNYAFTTWKGGAQTVDLTDWSPLRGRKVIILPDADEPGSYAGQAAYSHIVATGAESVSIVDTLSLGLPKGWDIADYPNRSVSAPKFVDLIGGGTVPPDVVHGLSDPDDSDGTGITKRIVFRYSADGAHREQAVRFFNNRFGLLVEGGKMNVVDLDKVKKNPESAVLPENVFHSFCSNIRIQQTENGALKPASKYWITSDCRKFDRAGVRPDRKEHIFVDENGDSVVNLWQGFAAETMDQSGSCDRFLEHMKFVCSGEDDPEELHRFITTFFARMVQAPHNRQGAILLFRGNQGSGKSIIGEYLSRMMGSKASITVNKLERVTGQFNAQLAGKILCRVEEVKIRRDEHYEALKDMSTNPLFTMEAKGKTQVTRENYLHFVFTGNYEYMAPVAEKERRLVPVDVPDDKIDDIGYFEALVDEMNGSGPGALFKYLKEYPLPASFIRIPQSKALQNQKSQTKSFSHESPFLDWYAKTLKNKGLQSGPTGPSFVAWRQGEEHDRVVFWDTFNAWQKENSAASKHLTRRFFYRYFEAFQCGKGRLSREIGNDDRGRFMSRYSGTQLLTFPNLKDAKEVFMQHVGNDDTYDVFSKEDAQKELIRKDEWSDA